MEVRTKIHNKGANHVVQCPECGETLYSKDGPERTAFHMAVEHASSHAHEVIVSSTVTTVISGYVDEGQ